MAAVGGLCAVGGDALCSREDSKQAEEVERGGEDGGDGTLQVLPQIWIHCLNVFGSEELDRVGH